MLGTTLLQHFRANTAALISRPDPLRMSSPNSALTEIQPPAQNFVEGSTDIAPTVFRRLLREHLVDQHSTAFIGCQLARRNPRPIHVLKMIKHHAVRCDTGAIAGGISGRCIQSTVLVVVRENFATIR